MYKSLIEGVHRFYFGSGSHVSFIRLYETTIYFPDRALSEDLQNVIDILRLLEIS